MRVTAYDRRTAARAAGLAAVSAAVAAVVTVATDGGAPWAMRVGLLAALLPVAGTLGALGAVRVAAGRGELLALAAVGVDPQRSTAGAAAGGAVAGVLGPLAAALGAGDLSALFPRPAVARRWVIDGDGLRELTLGVRVGARGAVTLVDRVPAAAQTIASSAPRFAIAALAAAAIVCPIWAALPGVPAARRAIVGGAAMVLAVVMFQAVAAGRAPPAALLAAPLILVLDAAAARYRAPAR